MLCRYAPWVTPYHGIMTTRDDPTLSEAQPLLSVAAAPRPVQVLELVGVRYRVRKPKDIIGSKPTTDLLVLANELGKQYEDAQKAAKARQAGRPYKPRKITLTEQQIVDGFTAMWRYLKAALVDKADYAAIRRRIAGDIPQEAAESIDPIDAEMVVDDDALTSDDLEQTNIMEAAAGLIQLWNPDLDVKENSDPPPVRPAKANARAAAKAASGGGKPTVRKRSR